MAGCGGFHTTGLRPRRPGQLSQSSATTEDCRRRSTPPNHTFAMTTSASTCGSAHSATGNSHTRRRRPATGRCHPLRQHPLAAGARESSFHVARGHRDRRQAWHMPPDTAWPQPNRLHGAGFPNSAPEYAGAHTTKPEPRPRRSTENRSRVSRRPETPEPKTRRPPKVAVHRAGMGAHSPHRHSARRFQGVGSGIYAAPRTQNRPRVGARRPGRDSLRCAPVTPARQHPPRTQ